MERKLNLQEHLKKFHLTKEKAVQKIKTGLKYGVVYTHDGPEFHADEVMAIALLEIYRIHLNEAETYPPFKVIRERNIPESFKGLRLDVNGSFLDHHMPKKDAPFRKMGLPYATAGLLWALVGPELSEDEDVFHYIDTEIFEPIDTMDNGVWHHSTSVPNMINNFNLNWNEEGDVNLAMTQAVEFASQLLQREIATRNAKVRAYKLVDKDYQAAPNKEIVILEKYLPWEDVLIPTEAKFVIWEDKTKQCWNAQAVPIYGGSFELKNPFKEEWKGLQNKVLQSVSNLNLNFCHSNGFFIEAADRDSAIAACKESLTW